MITTQCPQCRKRFQLAEAAVGRLARCRCGASWKVQAEAAREVAREAAADGGVRDLSWEDEVAGMFGDDSDGGAASRSRPQTRQPAPAPVAGQRPPVEARGSTVLDSSTGSADAETPIAPPVQTGASFDADLAEARAERARRRIPEELVRQRPLMATLCYVYGPLMALVVLAITDWMSLFGFCFGVFDIALSAGVVASGVMIRRGEEHAHAWAGLACVGLCFIPAWGQLRTIMGLATAGLFLPLALTVALFAALFTVPCYVTHWALRYEQARQTLEEESKL